MTNLLSLADRYKVQKLKKLAINRLKVQLTAQNVHVVPNGIVNLSNVDNLIQACLDFYDDNQNECDEQDFQEKLNPTVSEIVNGSDSSESSHPKFYNDDEDCVVSEDDKEYWWNMFV